VIYEGATPVFIDSERDTWNMDPVSLEKAFAKYPDARVVLLVHLYGVPAKMDEIREVCKKHDAVLIEDAAEALAATYHGHPCGTLGEYNTISFNGNKIITTSGGGMLICRKEAARDKALFWATQARENARWYQHEEIGYNYRMSNIIAGVIRGQIPYLDEHIAQKRAIYERYKEGLKDLPVSMNPWDEEKSQPNFWLSCMLIDEDAMAPQVRGERDYLYQSVPGKSSPQEILDALTAFHAEGRPIWKPMHMQPIYQSHAFITVEGNGRGRSNAYIAGTGTDVGADIFRRGLCLPSDNKMTPEEQEIVIKIIHRCFI
jgi:dTDP-4-amino-4,6-dideoxygalactose transaminase